jgi:hypothetical protein
MLALKPEAVVTVAPSTYGREHTPLRIGRQ